MSLLTDLINLNLSDYTEKIIAEYIWMGGSRSSDLRSKAMTLPRRPFGDTRALPTWNYHGSCTVEPENSEVFLYPRSIFRDPFRRGNNILVLCDCYTPSGDTIRSNTGYSSAVRIFFHRDVNAENPCYVIEQEYTLVQQAEKWPLVWPVGCILPSGPPRDCSVGADKSFGRDIADAHYKACIYAGIDISGINGGVMPGQWRFQVGPAAGISAADQLWVARYILERITENSGVALSFDPKPVQGHWNGAGAHTYYRTNSMGGVKQNEFKIKEAVEKLRLRHTEHISAAFDKCYRWHETTAVSSRDDLNRWACVRVDHLTDHNGEGYFEDKVSNMDPYTFTSMIAETTILWKPT